MEVLNGILGLNDSLKIESNREISHISQETDIFTNFLEEYKDFNNKHENANDSDMIKECLFELEKEQQDIDDKLNNIIPSMIDYLNSFNQKLSEYTIELSLIRQKSAELKTVSEYNSKKLANISPLVNDLLISPEVINDIIHGKINSEWIDNIIFIKDKQEMYSKYESPNNDVDMPKDFGNLCQVLEILKMILLERSRKFLISKIRMLRSSNPIPSQKLQKQLLGLRNIFQFIIENNYSLALEIRQAYAYTMRWYYREYFGRYIRSLTIMQFNPIDSQCSLGNVLINENNANSTNSLFSSYLSTNYGYSSTVTTKDIKNYFQINKRLSILSQEDNTVMVSQIAENNNNRKNFIELGFKNLNLAILDNCTVEYNFLKKFFQISDNEMEINGLLEQIFQPTLSKALSYTEEVLLNSSVHDLFGVLISIRIAKYLQSESTRRHVPIIGNYLDDQLILLWPKFQQLIDWQSESLNALTVSTFHLEGSSLLSSPHELTIAFTLFLQSLLILTIQDTETSSNNDQDDARSEPLYNSIIRIRNAYETILTKLSKMTKGPEKFLSVNYLYVYNSLQQQSLNSDSIRTNKQTIMQEIEEHFKKLVEAYNQLS